MIENQHLNTKGLQGGSNSGRNSLNVSEKNAVKTAEIYEMAKDHFKFLKDAFGHAAQQCDPEKYHPVTKALEGKRDYNFTLAESLEYSREILKVCAVMDAEVRDWNAGQLDDISVRWALYYRSILVFVYAEFSAFQNRVIYKSLTQ